MEIIPGTDGFKASTDGRIFGSDGLERPYTRNGDGYVTVNVRVKGKWITFGVHRLVALAFLSHERTEERRFVNHIDGNIENNHVSNLDWVTSYENNIHCKLLRGCPNKRSVILQSPSGEMAYARTGQDACELIGCSFPELWKAVKFSELIDGWSVKYNDGLIPDDLKVGYCTDPFRKTPVDIWDTETGDIRSYGSLTEATALIDVTTASMGRVICTANKPRLCLKRYVIVRSGEKFPDLTPEDIERLKEHKSRSVIALEVSSGERTIYQRAVDFYVPKGMSKKAVTVALRNDRIREIGGYVFLYLNPKNVDRLNSYASLSGETA